MDMSNMDKLRGMPLGFPFAMVFQGVASSPGAIFLGGIREPWFESFGLRVQDLGMHLIIVGGLLQGVLWICGAFGKHESKPPA